MEITLEQVERLREKANVSYAQAKQALEYSGGNLLDALIYLEEQGVIPRPEGSYYSTRSEVPPAPEQVLPVVSAPQTKGKKEARKGKKQQGERPNLLRRLRYLLLDNELEIWRQDQPVTALPVLILILLVLLLVFQHFLCQGQVIAGFIVLRIVAQRLLVGFHCLGVVFLRMKYHSHVMINLCQVHLVFLHTGSSCILLHSFLYFILLQKSISQVEHGYCRFWIRLQCFTIVHLRIHIYTVLICPVPFADVVAFSLLCKGRCCRKQQQEHSYVFL